MAKLISVILLSYNSEDKIQAALDSILSQTYPAIEIVVADDGSKYFDTESIRQYVEQYDKGNIQRCIVLHSDENYGTVQNLRAALATYSGQYNMILGADDRLRYPGALEDFCDLFECYHDQPLLICANAGMYDAQGRFLWAMLIEETQKILRQGDCQALFYKLTHHCVLLTVATCYRREFWDIVGLPDTDYMFLEDWPTFLRMARLGVMPVYMDKYVTCHTIGGIANGGKGIAPDKIKRLFADRQTLFAKEVNNVFYQLPQEEQKAVLERKEYEQASYYKTMELDKMGLRKKGYAFFKEPLARKHILCVIQKTCKNVVQKVARDRKRCLHVASLLLAGCFVFSWVQPFGTCISNAVAWGLIGLLLLLAFFCLIYYILQVLHKVRRPCK